MKQIPLTQGKFALVDDEDYDFLMQWKWQAKKGTNTFYATTTMKMSNGTRKFVRMHRLVLDAPENGLLVDHKNGDGIDNQRSNIRICSRSDNNRNRRLHINNTSGFRGVTWHKLVKKWQARIMDMGKKIMVGWFDTPEEAARAYDIAAKDRYGDFARLNFPS